MIEANSPGSIRHDVTSACFRSKVWFSFQKFTLARSILNTGRICHDHTLPQFMPRQTIVPRSLRSLLVTHCKRCLEYVVYDSPFQHSHVNTQVRRSFPFVLLFLVLGCAYNAAQIRSWCHLKYCLIRDGIYTILGISLVPFLSRTGSALCRTCLFSAIETHFSHSLFRGRSSMFAIISI